MKNFLLGAIISIGLTIQSYAGVPEVIAGKVADILTAKINADKDVAIEALKSASTITIDGEVYNHITIGERVVMIGNTGVVLLGDVNIGSIKNIVDIKKDAVVIGNVGVIAGGH
jgi:hypothetical protein